jgi:hypothetical protein
MSAPNKSQAIRGAYALAAQAVRKEVKKLSDLAKTGVAIDVQQHATLSSVAEQLYLLAVGSEAPPARLVLVEEGKRS